METAIVLIVIGAGLALRVWAGVSFAQLLEEQPEAQRRMMQRALARGAY